MFFYTGIPVMMAAAAVVMDLRTARVDNGWILFCMAAGLAMRILANGIIGVFWYFTGALIPVVLLGWLFVFRMLGPGDIKLLSVIGGNSWGRGNREMYSWSHVHWRCHFSCTAYI